MLSLEKSKRLVRFTFEDYYEIYEQLCKKDIEELTDKKIMELADEIKFKHRWIWKEM